MKFSYLKKPIALSALMALAVAVLFNICFMLFFAYGDYLTRSYEGNQTAMHEPVMQRPDMQRPDMPKHDMPGSAMQRPDMPPHHNAQMPDRKEGMPLMMFATNIVSHFLGTFILFLICFYTLRCNSIAEWKRITIIVIATIAWILLYGYLMTHLLRRDCPEGPGEIHFMRAMITISLFLGLIVFFSSLLVYYIFKGHEAAIENETLRTLNYSTQYEALKSKLDPHFLFNALNTLSGLIAIKSDRTNEYLQKLSVIFRTTLAHKDITTLSDELAFASAYGDLMTIRYEDSLNIHYDIPQDKYDSRIVSYSIQTLLENVIKHNTITQRLPMHITVTYDDGYVVVRNPVHPRHETETSNGLGLRLLSERSKALLGRDIIIENHDNTFTVKTPIG